MGENRTSIDTALSALPRDILDRSGSVFYSGRGAFAATRPLYLVGLNPGGDPVAQAGNTVAKHIEEFARRTRPWSAYLDDSWEGASPGSWGMQPRVLHMLARLGVDPRLTPAANLLFVRSRSEADLKAEKPTLIRACWPVHRAVLSVVRPKVIVCFGGTTGKWMREQLGASEQIDHFIETNDRGWRSCTHRATDGVQVVTTTHPARVDWRNPVADPTPLVQRALAR